MAMRRDFVASRRSLNARRRFAGKKSASRRHLPRLESLEERRLLAVVWDRVEPLGSLMFESQVAGEIGGPVSVFSDDFESGSLGPEWSTNSSTPDGRIEVSNVLGTPANSGSYHLAMDSSVPGPFNLNEAVLTVDLSGTTEASLSFAHKDVNDEDQGLPPIFGTAGGDGVSISSDGTTWHRLTALNNANSPNEVYTEFDFDLDQAAASAGIALGANFQIKFQQFDNFPFNTDGRAFDDINITVPGPLNETTTAFLEADQTLTVVATPEDAAVTLTVTVRAPGNTVLATATAAGPGQSIDIQTIGIAADGDYTIEVSGDGASEYDLALYRNAAVEVTDTEDGAEQDATGSFIPLGSGRFGIVGEFTPEQAPEPARPVVWGIQPSSGDILKIDPTTGGIIGSFPAPDALSPNHRINGLSIAEEGSTLIYVNGGVNGNNLYRLDPDDGTVLSVETLPGFGGNRGGLSFETEGPDAIFAIDDGGPVDRQAGYGGPIADWTPGGVGFPGALGGDDNGRLFVFRFNQIQEFSTTTANTQLNAFPLPPGAAGAQGLAYDGVHLYLSDAQSNLFTLDPDTGAVLNQVTVAGGFLSGLGADIVGGGGVITGGAIFTTHQDGTRLGTIDKATGAGTDIGPFGSSQTWAAAFDTDGSLYTTINGFSGNAILASVNQSTGAVTPIGAGLGTNLISLEVAADGTMYGIGYNNRILYEINKTTGVATAIGDTGINANMDLAFDAAGVMYATVGNRIWTVDTGSGASTLLGSFSGIQSGQIMGIMFDEADRLLATAYVPNSPLYEIDVNTLSASVIGNTNFFRPHGGDIYITTSGPVGPASQAIVPEATPDIYGDPGEPGRFPPGPNVPAQAAAPTELLVNGSFETGDFTGWTTVTTGGPFRPWAVTGGGAGGGFGLLQTQPQDGAFVAWNGFDGGGPMEFQMFQDVSIPADTTATLSWMDRVQWNFNLGGFASLPRLYDVEIRDPVTNAIVETVFSFSTGTQDVNPTGNTGWQTHSVDVSAYAGQTVRVFFREQIPQPTRGPGQIEFDAISLATEELPGEPDVDEYLLDLTGKAGQPIDIALSAGLGAAEPGELDLAIIVSEQNEPLGAPVAQLQATGLFDSITVLNARFSTPTLADLEPYETVLAYTNFVPENRIGLGNLLADYVDAGGHLAMATYAYSNPWDIEGRITTSGYSPLTNVNVNGLVSGNLVATAPADTIFDGIDVNAVTYFRNSSFAYPGLDGGAELLATDGAGHNMIARNAAGNVVGLNFYPRGITANNQELFDLIGNALVPANPTSAGNVTLELLDTDGTTVLATGSAVGDNFDLGILDFVVPADGVYTVRVSSQEAGRYGIVVTDPLAFDTEPNAPGDSPLVSLDAYEGALGFLGAAVAVGELDLSLLESFESLSNPTDSTYIPPDPIIAAGPDSLVAMVNTDIVIHSKTGGTIAKADLDNNPAGVGGVSGGFWNSTNTVFDPWVMYDPDSERFFAMAVDRSSAAGGSSRIYLAVSTDSTPTNLTTDWNKYVIDRTGTHQTLGVSTFPDYPKMGVDDDAIYITGNDFGIIGGGFSHVSLFAIEKAPLLSGGPANIVYDEVITSAFSVHPVVNYDPGAPMRFAEAVGSTGIRLHTISNVLTAPTRTTDVVSVPTFFFPPDVPQLGGPPLDSVSQRIMSGVVRDGSLWTAHAIRDPAVDTETVMRWYEFDVTGSPSLVQSGNVDPGPGIHTWMGSVNVDNDGDMAISFSISGPTQFAGIGYTGRLASDPPGTTRPVEIARSGDGSYSNFDGIGRNRWGDYSGLAIDPNGETFWLYNEYAASGNRWGTYVGAFEVEPGTPEPDVDTYTVTLAAGQQIGLSTSTPFDDPTDGLNLLDPTLEVLDPNGNSVAFDTNSGSDGKNAAIPTFTAALGGEYKIVVGTETEEAGEYVLSVNWAPTLGVLALSADMIFENESVSLLGSYSDQNVGDSHTVVVDWDDPNDSADSTFALPAINTLSVGDTFASTSDGAILEVTGLDLVTGTVEFEVDGHQYLDDGVAPGNGTASDLSEVTVSVTDDGGLTSGPPLQEYIVNGDFETGDLSGWNITTTGSANWLVNDGTLDPNGPGAPLPPISGNFDAVSVQGGPSVAILSEPIVIPSTVSTAVLSWSDRIRNHANVYTDPGQEWRVLVLDSGGNLIQEVYSTNPGDPLEQLGPNDRSFDLTALFQSLAGQTVQISFEQQSQLFFMNATLDNVSLKMDGAPSVLVKNVAPTLTLDPVATINENQAATLTGTITDPGLLDEHAVVVQWDDPNNADESTFTIPAASGLSVGDTVSSTTDSATLEITAVNLATGEVSFRVQHLYEDDGPAPGNNTPSDTSTITVTVADDDQLNFGDFSDTTGLALNGDAATPATSDGDVLRLATDSTFSSGSAFSVVPVNTSDGFQTDFSFRISDVGGITDGTEIGADGFTFTLQAAGTSSLGVAGGDLGYGGITPSVAIEFDTYQNPWDPSTNHLGVNVNGSVVSVLAVDEPLNKWDSGDLYFAWIDYDGAVLEVRVSTSNVRPATPSLTYSIDISSILGQDLGFAGFTGATGGAFGNHDIVSWHLEDIAFQQTDVLVENVEPEITAIAVSAPKDDKALPGEDVTLSATFTDIGLLDRHTVTIDWDDSSPNSVFDVDATGDLTVGDTFASLDGATLTVTGIAAATGEVSFSVVHQFATGGIFDVSLTVEDDDTGVDDANTLAWVTGVRVKDGVLQIIGSSGDDQVTVNQQGNGLIKVHADFLLTGNFETFPLDDVQQILSYLCEGDDHFTVAGNLDVPAIIHGDAGDDHLNAGRGPSVLVGGDGDDFLNGGGNDILIGGDGADRLVGGNRDDLLIAGRTAYDENDDALLALLNEWVSDTDYTDRVDNIRAGTGSLSGTGIRLESGVTVMDDDDEDVLTGSAGRDWFFFDPLLDTANDRKNNESEN